MKFWFVNQGTSYKDELKGGFIYAPKNNKNGVTFSHWLEVQNVKKGDVIFCNKKGIIMSVGVAMSDSYNSVIPDSIKELWNSEGFKVNIKYYELLKPLRFSDYKDEYMKNIKTNKNPFTVKGKAKMGYLFPLEKHIAKLLLDKINDKNINKIVYSNLRKISDKEEITEEAEQFEEISYGVIKGYTEEEIEALEKQDYTYDPQNNKGKNKKTREKTDPKLKVTRMKLSKYNCEIDCNHKTFTCASGKHQYLESHHIIPLNAQKDFINIKLDSMFNIIAICPKCHSQVHYAIEEEKRKIFLQMYNKRKNEMLKKGFDLNKIEEIFNKYYLKKNG